MIKLVFPDRELSLLAAGFRQQSLESFAFILARPAETSSRGTRLLVESIHIPAPDAYNDRTETAVHPSAAFRLLVEKRAMQQGLSLIYCHSHPRQTGIPEFSAIDDETEIPLADYSRRRVGNVSHIALLIGAEGYRARELGCGGAVDVFEIGRQCTRHFPMDMLSIGDKHHRQVLAFGERGQRAIQALRIAIIGLGGTGSVVAQQLAHLGIRCFLLIDPDNLDVTNLNRVVGALKADVGRSKVAIAKRMIKRLVNGADVKAVKGDVLDAATGSLLTDVDFVFCCTDSHGSRHFVNQLAYQYFIPTIDMGVVIDVNDHGGVQHFGGRVQMLAPGLGCLVCNGGVLDPNWVRWDLSSERQRIADPYFRGQTGIKQPSVISLNSTIASQAVTMFLAAVAGIPSATRMQALRGVQGDIRAQEISPRPGCVNCSRDYYFGKGSNYPLPVRAT
jgi:molybdopterin-synthase adenylyltransferase